MGAANVQLCSSNGMAYLRHPYSSSRASSLPLSTANLRSRPLVIYDRFDQVHPASRDLGL